jgi:hypothetical protein
MICRRLIFAIWSNNDFYVYSQQSYLPSILPIAFKVAEGIRWTEVGLIVVIAFYNVQSAIVFGIPIALRISIV